MHNPTFLASPSRTASGSRCAAVSFILASLFGSSLMVSIHFSSFYRPDMPSAVCNRSPLLLSFRLVDALSIQRGMYLDDTVADDVLVLLAWAGHVA